MPGNIRAYLEPVQLLFLLPFVAWYLLGASWLLQRALRAKAGRKGQELGPCVLGMLLAGLASAAVGGLTFLLVLKIGETPESDRAYLVPAIVLAVLTAAPTALLVLYASLQLPLGKLVAVSWPAAASVVAAAAALGTPAFLMIQSARNNMMNVNTSLVHLQQIDKAIREYEQHFDSQPPANLKMLTEEVAVQGRKLKLLNKTDLACPFLPGVEAGYFYFPSPSDSNRNTHVYRLRACEWPHPHSGQYRSVLFTNGQVFFGPDQDFEAMLNRAENKDFAVQYRAAEANRR